MVAYERSEIVEERFNVARPIIPYGDIRGYGYILMARIVASRMHADGIKRYDAMNPEETM